MYIDLSVLNEGITQDKRRLQALATDFIKIDERDTDEMLKFMAQISAQFNYYDQSNNIDGNWEDFFKSDMHVLLIMITRFSMLDYIDRFSAFENRLFVAEDDKGLYTALEDLLNFMLQALNLLSDFRNRLVKAADGGNIANGLEHITFDDEISQLVSYSQQANALTGQKLRISYPEAFLSTGLTAGTENIFSRGNKPGQQILNALPAIKAGFTNIGAKFNNLLSIATFYRENTDLLSVKCEPHMAMCVAFLNLFSSLQQKLNLTTKNHLDFYYKNILGINLRGPEPDTVHLVLDKDATSPDVLLAAGEELLAKVEGQTDPVVFTLDKQTLITGAQIVELKTLILCTHTQIENKELGDLAEVEPYFDAQPFITAAAYLKSKTPSATWPVFGHDKEGLPQNDENIPANGLGILLSSPLLYQPEGRRTITFQIYLEDVSFDGLISYFTKYLNVSKRGADTNSNVLAVSQYLLADAFVIDYTDTKGWKTVEHYTALLDDVERRLTIEIRINKSDEFVDVYNPLIHGGDFDTEWPVFRLMINNYSVNNPFTYLRDVKMRRVTIIADVKGSKAVKLQNSVGPISAVSTGQLFGPMPSVGSYLDIKSSNIFNKYTQGFTITLDWIDLPKEPGGWETFYRAYNKGIVNNSFQIKLSTLTDGKFIPQFANQQQMPLFEATDDGTLKATTQLKVLKSDMKRLYFNKYPLLDKQDITVEKNFTEGALRIELVSPKDAFGHKLFAQIFPEVVIYNAKHKKKLELPNQPYIPAIRSISVDYVLEDSELLGAHDKTDEENDLKIFHIYPFGYTSVYPGRANAPYHLIPDFDYDNNLFIGLTDIKPGQVLTLLFQLDENNLFSKIIENKIVWSYLDNNNWIDFTEKEILFDTTNNFINSGIIEIKLPENFKTGNTILSPKLYWIRAASKINIRSIVKGIYTQAVSATRIVTGNPKGAALLPGSIKTFKRKILGIQSITQPFYSFGGKVTETDEQYYTRVSERLKHGQRLLTCRDIELAILERFPEIYMAKCIDPKAYGTNYIKQHGAGLRVILIPVEKANGSVLNEQPMLNLDTRYRVNKFLQISTPSFLNVIVKSPVYETIKVICAVKLNDSQALDTGLIMNKLNDDIKRFLCPWLFDKSAPFKMGSGIYMVEMINFIKNLPYIKDVSNFALAHFYFEEDADTDELKARVNYSYNDDVYVKSSLPQSVLVPQKKHQITLMGDTDDTKIGISEFAIMDELLVDADNSNDVIKSPAANTADIAGKNDETFDLIISHLLD
jgi:hypothetical protein